MTWIVWQFLEWMSTSYLLWWWHIIIIWHRLVFIIGVQLIPMFQEGKATLVSILLLPVTCDTTTLSIDNDIFRNMNTSARWWFAVDGNAVAIKQVPTPLALSSACTKPEYSSRNKCSQNLIYHWRGKSKQPTQKTWQGFLPQFFKLIVGRWGAKRNLVWNVVPLTSIKPCIQFPPDDDKVGVLML